MRFSNVRWLAVLLVAAAFFAALPASAQQPTFPFTGVLRSVNRDGSFVVTPVQNGSLLGYQVVVATSNYQLSSMVRTGDLVTFNVYRMANGNLNAVSANIIEREWWHHHHHDH